MTTVPLFLTTIPQTTDPAATVEAFFPGLEFGWGALLRATVMVVVGLPLLLGASRWVRRWVGGRYSAQQGLIAGKVVFYPGVIVLMISILGELGFSLTPLLGAAGVIGIAIGFASQTSVSNVISGLFLIAERPFQVDDVIQVGTTTGRVMSIDTLSIKLRTFDNKFVRIPNETIVKSEVTTVTRFPIRRLDLKIGVAYREEIGRVRKILLDLAAQNPAALMEPEPVIFFDGYGDSSVDLRLGVWVVQEKFMELKNSLLEEVKSRFDREGIEIPFPHRTLYPGTGADPLQVRLVRDGHSDSLGDSAESGVAENPGGGREEGEGP
jgi:small-conductance mechanosensitive channel